MPEDVIVALGTVTPTLVCRNKHCQLGIKCVESGPQKRRRMLGGGASIFTRVVKKGLSEETPLNREPHSEHVR